MDSRSLEWLQLLPPDARFTVRSAPRPFHDLIEPWIDPEGRGLVTWGADRSSLDALGAYESLVLVNARRGVASALARRGYPETVTYVALPALDRTHWLLPVNSTKTATASLGLVTPWRRRDQLKRRLLRVLARTGQLDRVGDTVTLARHSRSEIERRLAELFRLPGVIVAMKTGPLGGLRKTTMQVMTERGETVGFAKLATSPEARAVVEREVARLQELSGYPALQAVVPMLRGLFDIGESFVSVLAPGPTRQGPRVFGEVHCQFLEAMVSATGRRMPFRTSEMWKDMTMKSDVLMPQVSAAWRDRLLASMSCVDATLGPRTLLVSMAHRDFGPWNTRLLPDGRLWVFDWDTARGEMIPLYDVFSFFLRERRGAAGRGDVVQAAHTILESCKRWAPDVEVSLIPVLFLAYLVECSLSQLMGAMKNQAHLTHEWLTMAADLLDRQREWMPRDAPGM